MDLPCPCCDLTGREVVAQMRAGRSFAPVDMAYPVFSDPEASDNETIPGCAETLVGQDSADTSLAADGGVAGATGTGSASVGVVEEASAAGEAAAVVGATGGGLEAAGEAAEGGSEVSAAAVGDASAAAAAKVTSATGANRKKKTRAGGGVASATDAAGDASAAGQAHTHGIVHTSGCPLDLLQRVLAHATPTGHDFQRMPA